MILIGGQALRNLGSDRHTEDIDFLINDKSTKEVFIADKGIDYINSANNSFFAEIYKSEKGNKQASPQALLELKAYAFVQHCQNFNFAKADACEYDIKFLVRNFDVYPKIVKKYVSSGEFSEIAKVINSVKK
jgi:hypothetical protein